MVKRIGRFVFLICLMILFTLQVTSALETPITVKTIPNGWVIISIFEAGSSTNNLQSFYDKLVNSNNEVMVTHSSDKQKLDIEVYVKQEKNGASRYYKKYKNVPAGTPFVVSLPEAIASQTSVNVSNSTNVSLPSSNTTNKTVVNMTNGSASNQTAVTGNAIAGSNSLNSGSQMTYILIAGAVIIAAIIIWFLRKKLKRNSFAHPPRIERVQESRDTRALESELRATKARLESSQRELARLKNEEKAKEIERRIAAEREELRRLRQG